MKNLVYMAAACLLFAAPAFADSVTGNGIQGAPTTPKKAQKPIPADGTSNTDKHTGTPSDGSGPTGTGATTSSKRAKKPTGHSVTGDKTTSPGAKPPVETSEAPKHPTDSAAGSGGLTK